MEESKPHNTMNTTWSTTEEFPEMCMADVDVLDEKGRGGSGLRLRICPHCKLIIVSM